ncbi:unnamed protein product [Notodromas monacha]|uniref:Mediator of RNA polymerase II transcription subunit 24 n=1 Tax=Notodromas monacha TaxID=399045 RepID=A0A7R9GFB7_9CRUS|nr:unnamed protein product [Notodromas monacha]CAG0920533.1 unnamed protein product [Notodromas monacha]
MTRIDDGVALTAFDRRRESVSVLSKVVFLFVLISGCLCRISGAGDFTKDVDPRLSIEQQDMARIPQEVVFSPKEKPVGASRRSVQHHVLQQTMENAEPQDRCPQPAYPINKATYCSGELIRCNSDEQCPGDKSVCCFNGCIFTCMLPMDQPPTFDWNEETEMRGAGSPLSGGTGPGAHFESLPVRYDDPNVRVATGDDSLADQCHLSATQYQTLQDFRHHDGIKEWQVPRHKNYNQKVPKTVISHLRAVFSDPGLVPFAKTRVDFSDKWDAGGETMRDVDWTMCSRCESYRPPRAHHCRICKRCVRKMDHHCPWINNCVGEWNRKYFIQFLVWIGVLSVYAVILVGVSWLAPPCITCDREETIVIKQSRVIHSVALVLEALLFGLFVAAIMCDQFSSILSDATAVEQVISKSEGNGLNTFRKPAMALLAEVFGRGSVMRNEPEVGDGVALAQALLKQAVVGPGINKTFLGYLKYCTLCRVISLTSLLRLVSLEPVSETDKGPRQRRRLAALIELLSDIVSSTPIMTSPQRKDCLEEAKALFSMVDWVVRVLIVAYTRLEEEQSSEYSRIVDRGAGLLHLVLMKDELRANLIRVAAADDKLLTTSLRKLASKKFKILTTGGVKRDASGGVKSSTDILKACVAKLEDLDSENADAERLLPKLDPGPAPCALVSLTAVLIQAHLYTDAAHCGLWLGNVCTLKGLNGTDALRSIICAALLQLQHSDSSPVSRKLVYFQYKLPMIFESMHNAGFCERSSERCEELEAAVMEVSNLNALLFRAQENCGSEPLDGFLKECVKKRLIGSDTQRKAMEIRLKNVDSINVRLSPPTKEDLAAHLHTLDAKLQSIVAYLSSNESVSRETVLGSMATLKSNSGELSPFVIVAAVTGRLEPIVDFCVSSCEVNENSGCVNPLFETGFLFLTLFSYVAEEQVVGALASYPARRLTDPSSPRKFYDFFVTWMETRVQAIRSFRDYVDMDSLDAFIGELSSLSDLKPTMSSTKLCWAAMAAVKEILAAWESGALLESDAGRLIAKLSEKSAVSSACIYSWLVAKVKNSDDGNNKEKAIAALKIVSSGVNAKNDVFGDKMDLFEKVTSEMRLYPDEVDALKNQRPCNKIKVSLLRETEDLGPLESAFHDACCGGNLVELWRSMMAGKSNVKMNPSAVEHFLKLWRSGGAEWFIRTLVDETFKDPFSEELDTLVDMMVGLFHIDIGSAFTSFVDVLMPLLITSTERISYLSAPFVNRLAALFVAVTHCRLASQPQGFSQMKIKRSASSEDVTEDTKEEKPVVSEIGSNLEELFQLLKRITVGSRDPHFDPRMRFALGVLKAAVEIGSNARRRSLIVPHVPRDLVEWFVETMGEEVTYDLLMKLVDLSSKQGRVDAAFLLMLKQRVASYGNPWMSTKKVDL